MDNTSYEYCAYLDILREELVPAMGCTEPISLAYAAAKCGDVLNEPVQRCELKVSGPIIKNVKSVVVPYTGGRKGIQTAVAAGIVGGDANAMLEVLSGIREEQQPDISDFMEKHLIKIELSDNDVPFYIDIIEYGARHNARVLIQDLHTNITLIQRNGETIWQKKEDIAGGYQTDHSILNVKNILDFAM